MRELCYVMPNFTSLFTAFSRSTAVDVRLDGKFKAVLLGRDGAVPDRFDFS